MTFHQMETTPEPPSRPDLTMAGLFAAWGTDDPHGFAQWLLEPNAHLAKMMATGWKQWSPADVLVTEPDLACRAMAADRKRRP